MKFTFAPEATPLPGYTIKRAIDRGGFGEVYYALSDSGKEVALKLLQRNQQVELRGVSQCLNLKHPNLVSIFDIRTDADGDHWVVMEYVAGQSLEAVLDEHPQGLMLAEVEDWLAGIAAGTAFLHDRGIVHRDLKPANVFRENGVVKIGDVGLSKFITPSRRSAQTESVGTVYYMAPEVARGKYGSELDVYSLGVILYEMLTGQVPFSGESTGEILMKHLTEPPDLSKIPAQFRAVLGRALDKDPNRRTPGTIQLLAEFRRARQGKPIAEEIPASHFVDVPQLERRATLPPQGVPRDGGRVVNGNAPTMHYPAGANGAPNPCERPRPPAPPPSLARRAGQQTGNLADEFRRRPWLAVVVAVVFMGIFVRSPLGRVGSGLAFGELFALGFVSFLTYFAVTKYFGGTADSPRGLRSAGEAPLFQRPVSPPAASPPVVVPVAEPRPAPPPCAQRVKPQPPTPDTFRWIPLRRRLSDLSGAMTMAVVWSVLATAIASALSPHMPGLVSNRNQFRELFHSPAGLGLFGLTTMLGSWAILVASKSWEGSGIDRRQRRLIQTALGAAVGACAYGLHELLMVDVGYSNPFPGIVTHIGSFELLTNSPTVQPALAGYVVYFAALFAIRRWWWLADAFRPKRFRVTSLVMSGLVSYFLPAAFVFNQDWGVLWGVAISAVVQLSAPWVAVNDRPDLVRRGQPA